MVWDGGRGELAILNMMRIEFREIFRVTRTLNKNSFMCVIYGGKFSPQYSVTRTNVIKVLFLPIRRRVLSFFHRIAATEIRMTTGEKSQSVMLLQLPRGTNHSNIKQSAKKNHFAVCRAINVAWIMANFLARMFGGNYLWCETAAIGAQSIQQG